MSVREKFEEKLKGGKFRLINEKMYKNQEITKEQAKKYHLYYSAQIKKWPADPKKLIIEMIKISKCNGKIADIGCGDAEISKHFDDVVSFDKYPLNKKIIEASCDSIPSEDKSFDAVVCCLSLMMPYISKVVREVSRILKNDGVFYIAEVRSRITNLKAFISTLEKFGFKLKEVDTKNTHFVLLSLIKEKDYPEDQKLPVLKLSPCLYKKR